MRRLIGARLPPLRMDWSEALLWFFRITACFQLLKALLHWGVLLGVGGTAFESGGMALKAATVYFAVLDPVAAVGLWLTSSWGAVIWLLAAASQIALSLGFPEVMGRLWIFLIVDLVAVGVYVWLTVQVARAGEETR